MKLDSVENTTLGNASNVAPPLHAFVVGPAVGSLVLLFALVGIAAATIGAFSGLAYRNGVTKHGRRTPF